MPMLFQATFSMTRAFPWMPQLSSLKPPMISHLIKPPFSHHTIFVNVNHGLILPGQDPLSFVDQRFKLLLSLTSDVYLGNCRQFGKLQ
jgi:hypothetical protein